jgi:hypothetical protein
LAPTTPPQYSSPVDHLARSRLVEAYTRSAQYYEKHGEEGLKEHVKLQVKLAAKDVLRLAARNETLEQAQ